MSENNCGDKKLRVYWQNFYQPALNLTISDEKGKITRTAIFLNLLLADLLLNGTHEKSLNKPNRTPYFKQENPFFKEHKRPVVTIPEKINLFCNCYGLL